MAEATAQLKNYRQAPRKVRLLADLVRGKTASRALDLLSQLPKRASEPMSKLIKSAVANAKLAADEVVISSISVNEGLVMKRQMPRARGRASQILKRTSHIALALSKKPEAKKAAPKK
jgi:large subunit ribosomal protein L22